MNNPTDWRALLPQLQGLPLLPCKRKTPTDPATGEAGSGADGLRLPSPPSRSPP
jgi:hypothetical protein